ncbi:DNA-directed RNA polymerase subunit alpha [Caerostris extrusa]|uniref:DNA-directed RNA polymerase subunit alpha n=1 Tax=Caerostris extrusa TaxID=172846 RepID=A0AAV4M9H4_CAEEX|nr:DNA-directed RNA polymerase subunit alpha [Caerostris extrusa]
MGIQVYFGSPARQHHGSKRQNYRETEKLLWTFSASSSFRGHNLLFSAVHLTIARVIRRMCSISERYPHEVSDDKTIGPKYLEKVWKETFEDYRNPKCPKTEVKKFIQHITEKLKTTTKNTKRACYIEKFDSHWFEVCFAYSEICCIWAQRIKKILPQVKSFHIGFQHAQNIQYSLFDEIRDFGLKLRYEMTPSNESFFPSAVYSALGYNEGSMRDTLYKFALNSRGFTSRNMLERIIWEFLGLKAPADIPKEKEHEIFSDVDIIPRDPDFWQFTFFQKIFYSSSYYYFDSKESQKDVLSLLKEHFSHFMHHDASGSTVGHLVKVFIPSSYQSRAMPHALPYPVQFEMKKPIIISLKVKVDQAQTDSGIKLSLHVDPSVYFSSLYTNEVLNLGDCKHFGVYHENKDSVFLPLRCNTGIWTLSKDSRVLQLPRTSQEDFHLQLYSWNICRQTLFGFHTIYRREETNQDHTISVCETFDNPHSGTATFRRQNFHRRHEIWS